MSEYVPDDDYYGPDPEIEEVRQEVGEIRNYLVAQRDEAQREAAWDQLLDDHPDLQDEETAEPYAAAIEKAAKAEGEDEDDPEFARQVVEQIKAEQGSGVAGQQGPMSESDARFLRMADRQSNQGVRAWHKRLGQGFGPSDSGDKFGAR